ncbi:hypothetical protein PHYSODRAFT_250536 [Phytophthora sojae]|uniref:SET domain-containing protein n=1 Tax=Phytophthora sojae (strain P6497) TaxID=1094619 RepID=G4ZXK5_PHYSP|nr:hypothetical protein PHYSODRAFT_250536 [Phytophthora sojae]EGZ11868.1 hypothetical protein PHYSODRAFT_250536 [Phytophthora sojae]|eukprot:XP_009532201.1 hypothetical protein PHYSODRAFT_250536 [Phytophthora sojae]
MARSTTYWRVRCIQDSSDEENTPPNVVAQGSVRGEGRNHRPSAKKTTPAESDSSTGTATPPWVAPQHGLRVPKADTNPAPPETTTDAASSTPPPMRNPCSPTTSSPVLMETPPSPPPPRTRPRPPLRERRSARQERRAAAGPYARRREQLQPPASPTVNPSGLMRTSPAPAVRAEPRVPRPRDRLVPAQWPFRVAHLREQFNPLGTVFPAVPHFGCEELPQLVDAVVLQSEVLSVRGHVRERTVGVDEERNARTRQLSVVATDDIESGEVLGQYLGELEHHLGGLMRFVNHSCEPVATFHEVANGRRTTVVVATTEDVLQGQEITVDYGDDLWFVCRCGSESCRHRAIQDQRDPRPLTVQRLLAMSFLLLTSTAQVLRFEHNYSPPPSPPPPFPMAKLTGSSNYKVNEVRRLLVLVAKYLPLGQDKWERLASHFNANRGRGVAERDYEAQRYPKLANSSNRLGGGNLADFRDTVGRKRAYEELTEASYAKAKRARAAKATTALKKRLSDLERSASRMGGNLFEMMLVMREENERKAEARRMEEEQRRRDELAAREARYLADKAEAVERRRQEKVEIEERARRDKEEARARTQELMLLIGALTKKD